MAATQGTKKYTAYLLRIWRNDNQTEWHVSLQQAGSKQTVAFPSLFAAYKFLEADCGQEVTVDK